jgi:PST family polysaccharide transporter
VAFPTFSRIQGDPIRIRRAFYKATQYTSLLAFPAFIGLAALAPELVPTLFGEQWTPSIPVMRVLALIGILQSVLFFNGSVIKATGKPAWNLGIMFLTTVCSVIGFLIAVHWGIVAIAVSFVIAGYLVAPVSYAALYRLIKVDIKTYLRQFLAPLLASLLMVAAIQGLKFIIEPQGLNIYLELSIYLSAGALTYLLVIILAARPLARQILDLVSMVLPKWLLRKTI